MDGNKKTEKRYRNLLMFSVSRYNIVSYSVIIVYLSGCLAALGLLGVLLGVPVGTSGYTVLRRGPQPTYKNRYRVLSISRPAGTYPGAICGDCLDDYD